MLEYDIKTAHQMVRQQAAIGTDVRWDGWDIVFWRPDYRGSSAAVEKVPGGTTRGSFKNGDWGFENRFTVSEQGTWSIDPRNIKRTRRPRNKRR